MARDWAADDSSGGESLLDRDSYRRLADAAASTVAANERGEPEGAGAAERGAPASDD